VAASGTLRGPTGLLIAENQYLPAVPLLLAAICSYYRQTSFLFDKLIARGVLMHSSGDPAQAQASVAKIVSSVTSSPLGRLGTLLPIIVAVLTPVLVLTNGSLPAHRWPGLRLLVSGSPHTETWLFGPSGIKAIAWYFVPAFHGLALGMVASWAFGHLRIARVISHVLKRERGLEIRVRCPHPDGCMGLGPIADLAKDTALVLIALSLVLFLWSGGVTVESMMPWSRLSDRWFILAWALYCGFAPTLFFAPLSVARRLMWNTKQRALASAGIHFMGLTESKAREAAEVEYARIEASPVWPFTWPTLSSFASSIMLPVIVALFSDLAKRWFAAR
jgi:hypothetical protein